MLHPYPHLPIFRSSMSVHGSFYLLIAFGAAFAVAFPFTEIGKLPGMGWNSWNAFGCDVNESDILTAAKSIVDLGLKDVGYNTVTIDDCWSMKDGRDNVTGRLRPNTTRFPEGISGVADKVHSMGLKMGIYSTAGNMTCGGYPASLGHETVDAFTFADWGIDFLKYDNCNVPDDWEDVCQYCLPDELQTEIVFGPNGTCKGSPYSCITLAMLRSVFQVMRTRILASMLSFSESCFLMVLTILRSGFPPLCPPGFNYTTSKTFERADIMHNALDSTNRTILLNLCFWGYADVQSWGKKVATSWRSSDDIQRSPHLHHCRAIPLTFCSKLGSRSTTDQLQLIPIRSYRLLRPFRCGHARGWQ